MPVDFRGAPVARDIEVGRWSKYPVHVDRWAIVVGISRYAHTAWNLKHAHADAEAFHAMLRSPAGGAFEDDHIVRLIDEEATARNILKALRGFLKKPRPEDLVILYFACHGTPDPDRTANVYLLTHDTEPDDITTGLPMREIDLALRENMRAERAVIFADTCHSGSIGGRVGVVGRGPEDSRVVTAYLQSVSEAKAGIALITAAQAGETSVEGERWGGGHGVFTHYLLEGMRGAADGAGGRERDGIVTVRELYEYVRENVLRETANHQHPWLGPNEFDERLPIAITGGASANEHHRIGLEIDRLARLLEDRGCFLGAAAQLREAVRLAHAAGQELPEAQAACGLAWLDGGEHEHAVEALRAAITADAEGLVPAARYHLGLALEARDEPAAAVGVLRDFGERFPQHPVAAWALAQAARIEARSKGRRRALLIGAAHRQDGRVRAANDVTRLREILVAYLQFRAEDITLLTEAATRGGILDALEVLARQSTEADDVVVYFSGHAALVMNGEVASDAFLVPNDLKVEEGTVVDGTIGAQELHDAMERIAAGGKWLVLDTHGHPRAAQLARSSATYMFWSAARPFQHSFARTDVDGMKRGVFTSALAEAITSAKILTAREIHDRVAEIVKDRSGRQRPQLIGDLGVPVFGGPPLSSLDALARRGGHRGLGSSQLLATAQRAEAVGAPFPDLFRSLGWGLLEQRAYADATRMLVRAVEQASTDAASLLGLAIAHAARRQLDAAVEALAAAEASAPSGWGVPLRDARAVAEQLSAIPNRAVIVGIDHYQAEALPPLRGAVNDARAMHRVLVERCGFASERILLLLDGEATRQAIVDALRDLRTLPADTVTLFYFAGYGSAWFQADHSSSEEVLTIVPSDGRCEGIFDLTLDELRDLASNGGARPITIFDVGWTFGPTRAYPGARVLDPDPRPRELTRDIMGERETLPDPVGRCFICSSSIRLSFYSDLSDVEAWGPSLVDDAETAVHGDLTRALVDALLTSAPEQLTLGQLVHRAHLAPRERADELVFAPAREDLLARLLAIRLQPVRDAVAIFHDWIGRPGAIEQGAYYYLGLAHFVLGEHKAAIRALRKERELGAEGGARAADVAYYLGRAYLAHGELAAAVSELEAATRADLESIPAHYYLGEAIRQLVLKQTLVQAQAAFERYLEHGAPHGRADEVEAQIEAWRRQRDAEPETR